MFFAGAMANHAKKVGGDGDLFAMIRDKMENAAKAEGQSQAPKWGCNKLFFIFIITCTFNC